MRRDAESIIRNNSSHLVYHGTQCEDRVAGVVHGLNLSMSSIVLLTIFHPSFTVSRPHAIDNAYSQTPRRTPAVPCTCSASSDLITLAEVEAAAKRVGCEFSIKATGPAYRIELLWQEGKRLPAPQVQTLGYNDEPPPAPELLGYSSGFTQPDGTVHLEAIEIRKFTGFWARRKESGAKRYAAARKLNPGVLLAVGTCCWCREKSPFSVSKAELLCIKDDERQHRSLVRFYRRLGFSTLREIGSDIRSIADRIVWGGDGTLMDAEVESFARKWGDTIRAMGRAKS